jgi:hypothetical protein
MKAFALLGLALLFGCLAWAVCNRTLTAPQRAASPPSLPPIAQLPVSLTVKQRSNTVVPGSQDQLSITVDDVTRGQVMVSLAQAESGPLLGPVSMKEGETKEFWIESAAYTLRLSNLSNSLIGEDTVTFILDTPTDIPMSEMQKIEILISYVENMEGAVFIRNREEHSAGEAAKHLRSKVNASGSDLETASDFIKHIASYSSLTGEIYQIRMADGQTLPAGELLRKKLDALEAGN